MHKMPLFNIHRENVFNSNKMRHKSYSYLLAVIMSMAACGITFMSCGDDDPVVPSEQSDSDGGNQNVEPGSDAEQNTTDVAVTGTVSEVGIMYAQINGVVNLNLISTPSTNVEMGVEICTSQDFSSKKRTKAKEVTGRKFCVHVSQLEPQTTYYYRTYVCTSSLSFVGDTYTFTTNALEDNVAITGLPEEIGTIHAVLAGYADLSSIDTGEYHYFVGMEYATSSDFSDSQRVKASVETNGNFLVHITLLSPQTTYYYRTYVRVSPSQDYYGEALSFTTKEMNSNVAVTEQPEEVCVIHAILTGSTDLNALEAGDANFSVGMEYGTSPDFSAAKRIYASVDSDGRFSVRIRPLMPQTNYYYRTFVRIISLSLTYYGETYTFTTKEAEYNNANGYADLGLSSGTLWATMNVGATKPEECGNYFAWGETKGYYSGKTDFNWSTYTWSNGGPNKLMKYCNNSNYGYNGFTDNLTELELTDDAAYVIWGSSWRMPTIEQWNELLRECEWLRTTVNGVNGFLVVSRTGTSASIFLPTAGGVYKNSPEDVGKKSSYWSRSLKTNNPNSAHYLFFSPGGNFTTAISRYLGLSIRPIRNADRTSL